MKTLCNVAREAPDNFVSKKIPYNVVLILLGQHCIGKNLMLCCLRGSRQLCIRKNLVQYCLNTLWTTLHSWKPYAMLPETLQTTLYRKKSCAMLSYYSWDNIPQVKILCNIIRKASDNIVSEKILCNVVLILLRQHCTDKNPVQCCPRDSRQLWIRKMFHSMLAAYAILVLCSVVLEAWNNIAEEKNSGNLSNVV